jgi:quercetin dioxygenase-like cupin family protein
MKVIELEINHKDDRGTIKDIMSHEEINAVTHITVKKDAVRANHYHKLTTQWNYVLSGSIRYVTQMGDEERKEGTLSKGDFGVSIPMEKHAIEALEDTELMVFTKGPRGGKEYESDTFRLSEDEKLI